MSNTTLRFLNHEKFHRAAVQMAAAGAVAGLVSYLFCGAASPWALSIIAVAAVVGATAPAMWSSRREWLMRGALTMLAATALLVFAHLGEPYSALAGFSVFFAAALAWGNHGRRLLVALAAGAAVIYAAIHVFAAVAPAEQLASLPPWLVASLAGAAFSMVSVIALLPQHLHVARDPVADAYDELSIIGNGEVRDLVNRGYHIWTNSAASLSDEDPHRQTLEEAVIRLFDVGRRWNNSAADGAPKLAASLVDRIDTLDKRIDATEDKVAREQYQQAKAALAEQLRYIKEIGTSRERVLARMHNYLAAMERLRLAVINLESANASREAVQPLLTDVEELGRDIVSSAEAMAEADRAAASVDQDSSLS